jgi:hypothetical protein
MICTSAALCCLVFAEVDPPRPVDPPDKLRLVLTVNAHEVLQGDNLLVRIVLENPFESGIKELEPPEEFYGSYFEVQMRDGDEWRRILDVHESEEDPVGAQRLIRRVERGRRYAEYKWYHRDRDALVFRKSGKHELRAVTKTPSKEIVSNSVKVTVGGRTADELAEIERSGVLYDFFPTLRWKLSPQALAGLELGGNIKTNIQDYLLVQNYIQTGEIKGQKVAKQDMCAELKRHMDPVSWEWQLNLLGRHYAPLNDEQGLIYVVRAAPPYEWHGFQSAANHLAALRRRAELRAAGLPDRLRVIPAQPPAREPKP